MLLSLQSDEDKRNRWKYTLLVLDKMLDQIIDRNSPSQEFDINFVSIAESLPKLTISQQEQGIKGTKLQRIAI